MRVKRLAALAAVVVAVVTVTGSTVQAVTTSPACQSVPAASMSTGVAWPNPGPPGFPRGCAAR